MTQQEIQERNKQIALMLGAIDYKADKWYKLGGYKEHIYFPNWNYPNRFLEKDLKFHSDWNWLMEAVEFIQSLRLDVPELDYYIVASGSTFCNIRSGLNHADGETKSPFFYDKSSVDKNQKEAVFIAVSDFANLYYNKEL